MSKKKLPVIMLANQKGGVGKTTTATSIFDEFQRRGYKCLFIDGDPQRNSTKTLRANSDDGITTLYDVFFDDDTKLTDAIQHTEFGDVVAGDFLLADTDIVFGSITGARKINSLRDKMAEIQDMYQLVIIDSNPAVSHLMFALMYAATDIIIPMTPEQYSLDGFDGLYTLIQNNIKPVNPDLKISGIVITRYDRRVKIVAEEAKHVIENFAEEAHIPLYGPIYENVAIQEAQAMRMPIVEYDEKCQAAKAYKKMVDGIIKEVLENGEE